MVLLPRLHVQVLEALVRTEVVLDARFISKHATPLSLGHWHTVFAPKEFRFTLFIKNREVIAARIISQG